MSGILVITVQNVGCTRIQHFSKSVTNTLMTDIILYKQRIINSKL